MENPVLRMGKLTKEYLSMFIIEPIKIFTELFSTRTPESNREKPSVPKHEFPKQKGLYLWRLISQQQRHSSPEVKEEPIRTPLIEDELELERRRRLPS